MRVLWPLMIGMHKMVLADSASPSLCCSFSHVLTSPIFKICPVEAAQLAICASVELWRSNEDGRDTNVLQPPSLSSKIVVNEQGVLMPDSRISSAVTEPLSTLFNGAWRRIIFPGRSRMRSRWFWNTIKQLTGMFIYELCALVCRSGLIDDVKGVEQTIFINRETETTVFGKGVLTFAM